MADGIADRRLQELRKRTQASEPESRASDGDTPQHTPSPTPATPEHPTGRDQMVRTQHFLREDQVHWLDYQAKRSGRGVTRSELLRYAVDLYRASVEGDTPR